MAARGRVRRERARPAAANAPPSRHAIYHAGVAIEEPLSPPTPSRRRLIAPVTVALLVLALLAGGGIAAFLASQSAGSDAPPEAGPFVTPAPANPAAVFDVREADGDALTLLPANIEGEAFTATLSPGAAFEAFAPGLPADVEAGHWLTVIGEGGDPVRNYVIRQVIVIREPGTPAAGGLARSPAGFTGLELVSDPDQRPVLWGLVQSVAVDAASGGATVTLAGPDGPITVELYAGAPLFFIGPYEAPVSGGDRIAVRAPAGVSPAGAGAVLVAPQGAR